MKKASFVVLFSVQISQKNGTSFGLGFGFDDDSPFSSLTLLRFPKEVFLGTKLRTLTSSSSSSISERLMTAEVVAMGEDNWKVSTSIISVVGVEGGIVVVVVLTLIGKSRVFFDWWTRVCLVCKKTVFVFCVYIWSNLFKRQPKMK